MFNQAITRIVILGGGTAGWMTAAYLSHWLAPTNISVTLVESDQIGAIGVGEATVPAIHEFLRALGINEAEFIAATQATFKLGIEFEGWATADNHFFHPFAAYGVQIEDRPFYKTWWSARQQGYSGGLEEFCLAVQLARQGKFAQPSFDPDSRLAWYNYAYHFDASLFAKFLRNYAEVRRVTRIEGKLAQVQLNSTSGFIESLRLVSGQLLGGDLFIDCSGLGAVLIDKAMGVGYEDWSQWLLCDSALAVQTASVMEPNPYTKSIARSAGWQWHIPLQQRVGNGYVYASQFSTDEQARTELLKNLTGELLTDPRTIRFKTGMRRDFWHKNCVSIGLSSGFLEPLESTSISLIQTGIAKMVAFLVDYKIDADQVAEANRLNRLECERIRDFIILHYRLNGRSEPLWQHVSAMPIPLSLEEKIDYFRTTGNIKLLPQESFKDESWVTMFYGFGIEPPLFELSQSDKNIDKILTNIRSALAKGCLYAPSHAAFLQTLKS
jgi:tryptophan 7-halogenase